MSPAAKLLPRPPARKRWGQHFLVDPNLIRKVIEAIGPQPEDAFLEIGPGHGELTLPLAAQGGSVIAVEVDPLLIAPLRETAPPNVTVIQGDILAVDLEELLPEGSRIYGSLPYNITSPLIFRLLEHRNRWRDAHFIVQREVAERLAAEPGSRVYGRLSVMVQAYLSVQRCFHLPATVFRPRPKVDSTLVRLEPQSQHGPIANEGLFTDVVRLAFGQRRKKLANALKPLNAGELLSELSLANLRAEEVPVEGYMEIVRGLLL